MRRPVLSSASALAPLDPVLVRFVEALADANAERDHWAALRGASYGVADGASRSGAPAMMPRRPERRP
jgi:hypothetical protein